MKKILIILLGVITLSSCTQQKIGFVNTEKLIQDYKGTKIAKEKLNDKYANVQNELVRMETAFQEKVKKMSKRQLNRKMQELTQEDNFIKQKQQQVQYQYQNDGQKGLEKVSKEVNDFVKKYAKDNGYQFVLGTVDVNGSVLYGNESADITYDVLKALNNAYIEPKEETKEAVKETPKTEEKKVEETKPESK